MMDYKQLLKEVLTHSPYNTYKQLESDGYRDPNHKNPYLKLTETGLYDFKEQKMVQSLASIAKDLNIGSFSIDSKALNSYERSTSNNRIVKSYFQSRSIQITDDIIEQIGFKYSEYNLNKVISNPLWNIDKDVVSLNRIFIDSLGNKVDKKRLGSYKQAYCSWFGNKMGRTVYCFEGLEDALTHYYEIDNDSFYLVSYGASNFKNLTPFLKRITNRDIQVILDNDSNDASLNGSMKIEVPVKRYMPELKIDCNRAAIEGKIPEWIESLKEVSVKPKKSKIQLVNGSELFTAEKSDGDYVLYPILKKGEYMLVMSNSGQGKSWASLRLALAAAEGSRFIKWDFKESINTMYVDGEVGLNDCRDRVQRITRSSDSLKTNFSLLTYDMCPKDKVPNISDPLGQQEYNRIFKEKDIKLVVFDNYEYCSDLLDTSDNMFSEWTRVRDWFIDLRAKGITVVLVDHTINNESGAESAKVQGDKGKFKNANIVIRLEKPNIDLSHLGSHMKLTFDKNRSIIGSDIEDLYLKQEAVDGEVILSYLPYEEALKRECLRLLTIGKKKDYATKKLQMPSYIWDEVAKENKGVSEDIVATPAENLDMENLL